MKFGIDIGHNSSPDTGASGIKKEDDLTKAVGIRLIHILENEGHEVVNCTPLSASSVNNSLQQRVNKANGANVSIFVSIHFNAFNGQAHGTEVYAISNAAQGIATKVVTEIANLGFKNRGVKNTAFFVLKNTNMPAILVECCFCDSSRDMNIFNADDMAEAIASGLIKRNIPEQNLFLKVTEKTVLKPSTDQASDLPSESLINIEKGEYVIVSAETQEEGHIPVTFPSNSSFYGRTQFIFKGHAQVIVR